MVIHTKKLVCGNKDPPTYSTLMEYTIFQLLEYLGVFYVAIQNVY